MARKAFLLDTHVLIWMDHDRQIIPEAIWAELESTHLRLYSAASAWETAIKRASRKLQIREPLSRAAERLQITELAVTVAHGEAAGNLPMHHKDPFDRLLVAQARIEGLILVTADRILEKYDVEVLLI